ncbi:MAG TPA: hypothetical protein PLZ45_09820 [Ferruginibacter sp.]|nr:hypothetical protein [Chitinophagaceae bacterium]HRI24965.1 hypothetical protein [Ferruginibacter sp.]
MKTIEELTTSNDGFSIGQAISDGWNIIAKHLGYYILAGILATLITMAAGMIPFIGSLAGNLIISPCLMAGAIYITWQVSKGNAWTDFGDMFKGFSYLTPIMVSSLIQAAVYAVLILLLFFNFLPDIIELVKLTQGSGAYSNQAEIEQLARQLFLGSKMILLILVFVLISLVISAIWAFRLHFIVIYKMEGWPAMEMSRKVCTKNMFPLIGLFILLGIIIIISAIPCGIGLLFSLPLSIGALYSAFAQITKCDHEEEVQLDFTGNSNV